MPTAIKIENSKDVRVFGGQISGFDKGIEIVNSDAIIAKTRFRKCNVAIDMHQSNVLLNRPVFQDNTIDIIVNNSSTQLINTVTKKIIAVTKKKEIRINPFIIEQMGIRVINTRNVKEKKNLFRKLLKYLKSYTHIWAIYCILKEIARLVGYPI